MDNCSKSDSPEASQYEEETSYNEERRWTDLSKETVHGDIDHVSYRSIWICWKRLFQLVCKESACDTLAQEAQTNTNIPIPDWENISAEKTATVLEFKYTEWVINANYAFEHLFEKSKLTMSLEYFRT